MRNLIIIALMLCSTSLIAQNAGNILNSRNYVYPQRPLYIPMLQGDTPNLFKTSVDSLFIKASQVLGLFSGNYNDLTNKPTIPTVVQQYGVTYTKEFNTKILTGTSVNEYTVNLSSAGFINIVNIQATGFYNSATSATQPIVSIKTYSNTSVTFVVAESANTSVLIGGTIEGLTDFLKAGEIFITVRGN
jgi:hypothetical protein